MKSLQGTPKLFEQVHKAILSETASCQPHPGKRALGDMIERLRSEDTT